MTEMRRDLIVAVLAVSVALAYVAIPAVRPGGGVPFVETERVHTSREEPPRYVVDVELPVIRGLRDDAAMAEVNAAIRALADGEVAEFTRIAAIDEDIPEDLPVEATRSTFELRYTVTLLTDAIASIRFDADTYYSGAAHGVTETTLFTYDLRQRRRLALGDIFPPDARFRERIAEMAFNDLVAQLSGDTANDVLDVDTRAWIAEGAAPTEEHYDQRFTVDDDAITVYFDPYQVAAYVLGVQTVRIPYARLSANGLPVRAEVLAAIADAK